MVRKKKNNQYLKTLITAFKKGSEQEALKKEEKKLSKKNKPKGYTARKIGVVTIWSLLISSFLLGVMNVVARNSDDKVIESSEIAEAPITVEAVDFGKDFLTKYFTWSESYGTNSLEVQEVYSKKIESYISNNLLETAKKNADNTIWNSTLVISNVLLKNTDYLGAGLYQLTYEIKPTFTKKESAIEQEKKNSSENIIKNTSETKYVVLKVMYLKEEKRFIVTELPYFTYVENEEYTVDSTMIGLNEFNDPFETQVIEAFLNTFFDSYANDSKDKLLYFFEDSTDIQLLNKTMKYVSFNDLKVFEGKVEDEKILKMNVVLEEPTTKLQFTTGYTMVISNKANGYVVKGIDDTAYINETKELIKQKEQAESQDKKIEEVPTDLQEQEEIKENNQ